MPINFDDFDATAPRAQAQPKPLTPQVPPPAKGLDFTGFDPTAPREAPTPTPASAGEWLSVVGGGLGGLALGGLASRAPGLAKGFREMQGPVGKFVHAPQTILAPTSLGPEARGAEALIREKTGTGARAAAQAAEPLTGQPRQASVLNPATWVQKTAWADIGSAPEHEQRAFIGYVEGRSGSAKLSDPKLQPLADKVRDAFASVHGRMKELQTEGKEWARFGFVQDYYTHMWEQDAKHAELFSSPGGPLNPTSPKFTKERKIPTIEDGLKLGLTPRTLDPVQTTLEYVNSANRFITNVDILETAHKNRMIMRTTTPRDVPPGWLKLEGSLARRGLHNFYAPEGFARVYNNFIGKGFEGAAGDLYQGTQATFNKLTGLELGMSGFHASVMGFEGMVSEVSRGLQEGFGGKPLQGLGTIAKAPFAPYLLARTGAKVEQQWLGRTAGTKQMKEVVDLLTRAGGRGAGKEHTMGEYQYTAAGSFFDAVRRGSLRAEFAADRAKMTSGGVGTAFVEGVKFLNKHVGRAFEGVTEPLFKSFIPKIKNGAFYETMSSWMERNPEANMEAKTAAAREIWDSIDNRFGQVVQDNIFWDKQLKQVCMLAMRSYSWNLGTLREIGGGATDVGKLFAGGKFTPRAAYLLALPITYGFASAVYQVLKTGEPPQEERDYLTPKTGGIDAATGQPERRALHGYMKDVFGWTEPTKEAYSKLGGGPHLAAELVTGRDSLGRPLYGPDEEGFKIAKAYMAHIAQAFTPITAKSLMDMKRGTNVGVGERLGLGFQPAGQKWTDPERFRLLKLKRERKEWKAKQRSDRRQESYRE